MSEPMRFVNQWRNWIANQSNPQSYDNYGVNAFDYESTNQKNNVGITVSDIPVAFSGTNSPISNTPGLVDSFMKLPWMSTQGNTIQASNGTKTFTPGITGKFETLGGYGKGLLGVGSTIANIMGSLKQGKYADLQMNALKDQMKYARAQVGENYANQGAQRDANRGIAAPTAYTTGDKYAADRMAKWGV